MSQEIHKFFDGKLHLFKQPGCQNYFYRFRDNGKYRTRTTETNNFSQAKAMAESEYLLYRTTHQTSDGKKSHTWAEAEQGVLNELSLDADAHPTRPKTYMVKLKVLERFFGSMPFQQINNKTTIQEYVKWRRTQYRTKVHGDMVTNKTLRRDFDVLRQVLKYALSQRWIKEICEFPKLSVPPKSGGWFTKEEWEHLQEVARKFIDQSTSEKEKRARMYLYHYMMFLGGTGLRVDEALRVQFQDIKPDKEKPQYSYITVHGGKLSYRMRASQVIAQEIATDAIAGRKVALPGWQPQDLLFPVNPSTLLHELLVKAGLDRDGRGERRTARSLRHTYIMLRLIRGTDVYNLAKNCRTSVKIIEDHYGSHIQPEMVRDDLVKFAGLLSTMDEGDEADE